jgi:hypothetical protein
MMQEQDGIGVGIDDGCALQIDGGRFRVLTSIPDAKAHVLVSKNHEIVAYRPLPPQSDWSELDSIG